MKKFRVLIVMCGICMAAVGMGYADEGAASEPKTVLGDYGFTVSGDINVSSIYEWRGVMLDGDPVVQPGVYVSSPEFKAGDMSLGKLKLGFWMSNPLENKDALKSAEQDYIADYTIAFDQAALSLGHTYYVFPDALPFDGTTGGWSREVYTGIAFPKPLLSPAVFYYYDYGKKSDGGGEGSYTVLNLAYSKPFTVSAINMSLDLSGHVGYNNKQYYRGKGGDAGIGGGVTMPLTKSLTLKPNINYAVPWGNISDKNNGNQKNRFYYGVYLSAAF